MRGAALLLVVLVAPTLAHADTPRDTPAAVEVDREVAPPGRSELGFDAGAPVEGWAAAVSLGYVDRPITLRVPGTTSYPIARRETLAIGGAIGLGDAAVVDVRIPFARQTGDRLMILGDARALDRWVPGDLRIGGRVRVVGTHPVDAFIRAELSLPTGDEGDLAGDASWSVAWSLIGRFRLPAGIVVAGSGGIRLRGAEVMLVDRVIGDELHGGLGIAVPIPAIHPLWCVADQVKLTGELVGVLGDSVGGAKGPSPMEVKFGIVTRPRETFTIGVRAGVGLGDQVGSPTWRATLELTYHGTERLIPPSTPSSTDGDEGDEAFDPP